ncbi:UNVERIFIED_ORG: hypothetical protein QFZ59_002508 [Bacillus sp. B2I3]|nr:hypothetical protein [Bacillus sp. B2I3]
MGGKEASSCYIRHVIRETGHEYLQNPKEFVLGTLDLIGRACNESDDERIMFLAESLLKLMQSNAIFDDDAFLESYILDSQFARYEYLHDVESERLKKQYKEEPTLHAGERIMIRQIAGSILLEYASLQEESGADYGAISLEVNSCYQMLLLSHIPKNAVPYTVKVQHENDILVDMEFKFFDLEYAKERLKQGSSVMRMSFEPINIIHNDSQIVFYKYKHLSDETKRRLSAVISGEKQYGKSMELFPFATQVAFMMGAIESELCDIINAVEGRGKARSLYEIVLYMQKNPLAHLTDEESYKKYVDMIESLRHFRNPASHGREVSPEEYMQVKKFIFHSGILNSLSSYKKELSSS